MTEVIDAGLLAAHHMAVCELLEVAARLDACLKSASASRPEERDALAARFLNLKYELGGAALRLVKAEEALHGDLKSKLYPAPRREQ